MGAEKTRPSAGEVWIVDLGYKGKTRPCLVLSREPGEKDRVLFTVIPHTTSITGSEYEVPHSNSTLKSGGKEGVFNVQGIVTVGIGDFQKLLTTLNTQDYGNVLKALSRWLYLDE